MSGWLLRVLNLEGGESSARPGHFCYPHSYPFRPVKVSLEASPCGIRTPTHNATHIACGYCSGYGRTGTYSSADKSLILLWIANVREHLRTDVGGRGEIRTHDTLAGMPVFKTGALNHSATLPCLFYKAFQNPPPESCDRIATGANISPKTLPRRQHFFSHELYVGDIITSQTHHDS